MPNKYMSLCVYVCVYCMYIYIYLLSDLAVFKLELTRAQPVVTASTQHGVYGSPGLKIVEIFNRKPIFCLIFQRGMEFRGCVKAN